MPVPVNAHDASDMDISQIQQDYETYEEVGEAIKEQLAKVIETMAKKENDWRQSERETFKKSSTIALSGNTITIIFPQTDWYIW